jgi:hypothetical protein
MAMVAIVYYLKPFQTLIKVTLKRSLYSVSAKSIIHYCTKGKKLLE